MGIFRSVIEKIQFPYDTKAMFGSRPFREFSVRFLGPIVVGAVLFLFNNCGVLVQPGLDNMELASVGFRHTGLETSCTSCHEKDRPAPVGGVAHGNGADCVSCHNQKAWTSGGTAFSHTPLPTSCSNCHNNVRPATSSYPSSNNQPVNGHFNAKDCYTCHLPKSQSVTAFAFAHTNAAHQNINFCLPCHQTQGQTRHPNDSLVSFTGDGNCFNCHKTKRSWAVSNF